MSGPIRPKQYKLEQNRTSVNLITDFFDANRILSSMAKNLEKFSFEKERVPVITRIAVTVCVAFFTWFMSSSSASDNAFTDSLLHAGIGVYFIGCLLLGVHLLCYQTHSTTRKYLSIGLDVSAISGGLFLGGGKIDPIAVFYLWIMLGSGLVYGVRYLFFAGLLALAGFALVYVASPYWQSEPMFAATIAALILLLSPYLAILLNILERSRSKAVWQADHDGLTEIYNRRAFQRELSSALDLMPNLDTSFLLYMDLDKFKLINDRAGHAAGDQALVDVVTIFKNNTGGDDCLARMGGDEFCLLLVDQTLEEARRRSEKIRNDVASYRLAWGTSYYTLGVSIGVVNASAYAADSEALIRLADAACYAAKNNGRNQVHVIDTQTDASDTQTIRKLVLPKSESLPTTNVVPINSPRYPE